MGEYSPFPVLVSHMMERAMTSSELYAGQWSFREMLDKLLSIAALPVKQAMKKVRHQPASCRTCTVVELTSLVSHMLNTGFKNQYALPPRRSPKRDLQYYNESLHSFDVH